MARRWRPGGLTVTTKAPTLQRTAAAAELFTRAVTFFAEHAAVSWFPAMENRTEDIKHQAEALAMAELTSVDRGWRFDWRIDPDTDSGDWILDQDHQPYALWQCFMLDEDGRILQSLGGIDFGRDREPWGQPYRRVVQADLAAIEEGL